MSRKTLIAGGLATALMTSVGVHAATGIQIDPNGSDSIAGATFFDTIGGEPGHFLCHNCVDAPQAGTLYMMQSYQITMKNGDLARLSYQLGIPVSTSLSFGAPLRIENVSDVISGAGNGSFFHLYFDSTNSFDPSTDHLAGTGFDAGALIASGFARVGGNTNSSTLRDAGLPPTDIDGAGGNTADSITLDSGSVSIDINITDQNQDGDFIVNDLVNADLTNFIDTTLFGGGVDAPYLFSTLGVEAATSFGGSIGVVPNLGLVNDFNGGVGGPEDFQAQVSAEIKFNAQTVPEPTTLGLLGLGVGLAGFAAKRRNKQA